MDIPQLIENVFGPEIAETYRSGEMLLFSLRASLDQLNARVQQRAEADDLDHELVALDELGLERRPGLLAGILQVVQPAPRGRDDRRGERREREHEDPGHEAIEYIIGLRGTFPAKT